eukprot:GHVS01092121.1.p1 GENE.GHVS01092121.1~~GHVS01092121.1.p1  ORF type:complete len:352 (-),score=33.09 GHVS01092121.1:556-1611(-)
MIRRFTILRLADVIGPYDTTYRCIKTYWSLRWSPPGSVHRLTSWPAVLPNTNVPLDPRRNPLIQRLRARSGVYHNCACAGPDDFSSSGNVTISSRLSFTYSGDVTQFVRVVLKDIAGRTGHASCRGTGSSRVSVYNLCCAEAVTLREFLDIFHRYSCSHDKLERPTKSLEPKPQAPDYVASAAGSSPHTTNLEVMCVNHLNIDSSSDGNSDNSSNIDNSGSSDSDSSSSSNSTSGSSDSSTKNGSDRGEASAPSSHSNGPSDKGKRSCSYGSQVLPCMYPSVKRLIPLSVERVTSQFDWTPTPLDRVIGNTVDWIRQSISDFPEERKQAMRELPRVLRRAVTAEEAVLRQN